MITLQTLTQLEEMEKSSTPGEWIAEHDANSAKGYLRFGSTERDQWIGTTFKDPSSVYSDGWNEGERSVCNVSFIVSLRNHAPELLAMARYAIEKGYNEQAMKDVDAYLKTII